LFCDIVLFLNDYKLQEYRVNSTAKTPRRLLQL
jgi:hypothetical protein